MPRSSLWVNSEAQLVTTVLFLEVTLVVNIISSTQQTLIRLLLCSRHLCGTMGETE